MLALEGIFAVGQGEKNQFTLCYVTPFLQYIFISTSPLEERWLLCKNDVKTIK